MSRSYISTPSGILLDAELANIAGASVLRQSVESCPPRALIAANFTRPADVIAYAAGDAVTNSTSAPVAITLAGAGRYNGAGGEIKSAMLVDSAAQATKLDSELWVFGGAAAPTPDNDNTVFTPTDAELLNLIAIIVFKGATAANVFVGDATAGAGGNCVVLGSVGTLIFNLGIPYKCGAATTSLFGLLVARNAYTPVSAENFAFILQVEQE